jgi:RHS repeat-associated protein
MNFTAKITVALICGAILSTSFLYGQNATGAPPLSTQSGGTFDSVNLANLNVHFNIPIFSRAGRGQSLKYMETYDGLIWTPVTSGGVTSWQPIADWGWNVQSTGLTGKAVYEIRYANCTKTVNGSVYTMYYQVNYWLGYTDPGGTYHPIQWFTTNAAYSGCDVAIPAVLTGSGTAVDNSGYTLAVSVVSKAEVTGPDGMVSQATGYTNPTITDRNGNYLTTVASGSTTSYTDTLGTTALTVTVVNPTTTTYSYTAPSGGTAVYTFHYSTGNTVTKSGCGYSTYSSTTVTQLDSIELPDASQYTFTYDASGQVNSVTLPTGGTITYTYSAQDCTDGSPLNLTRTVGGGTWTYSRTVPTGYITTTITDPVTPTGNVRVVEFKKDSATTNPTGNAYEVKERIYQGTTSGTLLSSKFICYNGNSIGTPSGCPTTAVSSPITRKTEFRYLPDSSGIVAKTDTTFYQTTSPVIYTGLPSQVDEYDYGVGTGTGGALIRRTITTYATGMANGIIDRPATVTIQNGVPATVALTTYGYDQWGLTTTAGTPQHSAVTGSRGNLTQIDQKTNSTIHLYQRFVYYDTGTLNYSTEASTSSGTPGAQTTYNYSSAAASCGNTFPTSVTEPLSLSRSMTWDCDGAVQTSAIDENSETTSTSYTTDPDFWRPESATDALGNVTSFTYTGQNQVKSSLTFNTGGSIKEQVTTLDGLGRVIFKQDRRGPASTTYDTVASCYDKNGRVSFVSAPYGTTLATSTSPCPGGGGTTTTYDALNRVATSTDGGGGVITYTYSKNDTLQVVTPAPAGENSKQKQLEYDAAGRLASVCEVTSASGSVTCGQTATKTGYWTKYLYNPLNNLTQVTQNALGATTQTRTFTYDMIGRLISEKNPETSTTTAETNIYDSDTTCTGGTQAGNLVKRTDVIGNVICTTYDVLHRPTSVTYPSGSYAATTDKKFFVYDAATVDTHTMQNVVGRMAEAYTCPPTGTCTPKKTDLGFSYTARGELADTYEKTPNSPATYYHANSVYAPSGILKAMTFAIGATAVFPQQIYQLDSKGRWNALGAATGQNPVTGAIYNAFDEATSVTFGSADNDTFTFDANTGRMTQYQFKMGTGPQTDTGALTWSANGTLRQLQITDQITPANNQTCIYGYDDLVRVSSSNCGTAIWNQNFSYDVFGNINKTVPGGSTGISFLPGYSASTNRYSSGLPGLSYDSNGNLLNDSFNTYAWDAEGKAVNVGANSYVYDAFGRVVEKNSTTQTVYGPSGKLAIMNGSTLSKAFIPLPSGATAVYTSTGLTYYRHADWLSSSRLSTTPTRTKYYDVEYAPFGESYGGSGTTDLNFTGDNQDMASGLYDTWFREYHPTQGRWVSPDPGGIEAVDPANPQSWNRYAYVTNNPLSLVDPLGLTTGNDCNGPCNTMTYTSDSCVVNITYTQVLGGGLEDSKWYYDVPTVNTWCYPRADGLGRFTPHYCAYMYFSCDGTPFKFPSVTGVRGGQPANNCQAPFLCNSQSTTATIGPPREWKPAPSTFAQQYGTQLACEASVAVADWADNDVTVFGGLVGMAAGYVREAKVPAVGGLLLFARVTVGTALRARSTCVPIAWGSGHF